jgi:hypothetical protein
MPAKAAPTIAAAKTEGAATPVKSEAPAGAATGTEAKTPAPAAKSSAVPAKTTVASNEKPVRHHHRHDAAKNAVAKNDVKTGAMSGSSSVSGK